jgi:hypothetical protein
MAVVNPHCRRIWAELGAKDPEQLRQLLSRRAAKPLNSLAIQTTLDFVAALGGFYTGGLIGQADFTGSTLVSLVAYFFACYYFLQAASEVTALVAVWRASQRYSTDTDVLLAAMQQLAGPTSGLRVLDTVQLAVNTLKVIQALDSISGELKVSLWLRMCAPPSSTQHANVPVKTQMLGPCSTLSLVHSREDCISSCYCHFIQKLPGPGHWPTMPP